MKSLIVIPARYGSTRLPGKPLAMIAGQTMLSRVVRIAQHAANGRSQVEVVVATDDARIAAHCDDISVKAVMTPVDCYTGSDRALAAAHQLDETPDMILNLQGDVPLMPVSFVTALLDEMLGDPSIPIATPVVALSWDALDTLRQQKQSTPFSGTCVIVDKDSNAIWFSKNIIPAIRREERLRQDSSISPVFRHVGLYAYSRHLLERYVQWEPSPYEKLEGLEQLRILEHGYSIRCVKVEAGSYPLMSGVDSAEDIARAEAIIEQHGEHVT